MNNDDQAIKNLLFRIGSEVASKAKDLAPYDTGNLQKDIQVWDENIDNYEISIGNSKLTPYAPFVHSGTGIHGKYKRKITPKKGKALKTPYGLKASVDGQKANPYLINGLEEYVNGGGLNRALNDTGDDISEEVFKNISESFKSISVD